MTTLQLIQRRSGKAKMMILRTMMMMTREVSMKQWVALSEWVVKAQSKKSQLIFSVEDRQTWKIHQSHRVKSIAIVSFKLSQIESCSRKAAAAICLGDDRSCTLHGFTIAHCTVAKFHRAEQIGHFFSLLSEVNLGSRSKNLFFYRSLHSCSFLPSGLCWQEKRGAF